TFEQAPANDPVDLAVVHQQDAGVAAPHGRDLAGSVVRRCPVAAHDPLRLPGGPAEACAGRRGRESEVEPERRSFAGGAREVEAAAHELNQLVADGQAETGTAETAGSRCVGLRERLQEPGLAG